MVHGDELEEKWRGNKKMEWVTSKRHMTTKHRLARAVQTLQADVHSSPASSRLNWRPADLNELVRFVERRNLVSAHVPSHFRRSLPVVFPGINPLNAELNPICHLLILLGDLMFMGPCTVSIFQYTVYLYLETALHVSGGTSTHQQECIQLYLQHLVFVTPLLLSAAISWNRFDCAVGGVRHPQHTQTGSNWAVPRYK
jgi:hypothetical protein